MNRRDRRPPEHHGRKLQTLCRTFVVTIAADYVVAGVRRHPHFKFVHRAEKAFNGLALPVVGPCVNDFAAKGLIFILNHTSPSSGQIFTLKFPVKVPISPHYAHKLRQGSLGGRVRTTKPLLSSCTARTYRNTG